MTEGEAKQTLLQTYSGINRLGVNTKRDTHGLGVGIVTLLLVWAMEDRTRDSLSVEVILLAIHMMTCGYWIHSQAEWRR